MFRFLKEGPYTSRVVVGDPTSVVRFFPNIQMAGYRRVQITLWPVELTRRNWYPWRKNQKVTGWLVKASIRKRPTVVKHLLTFDQNKAIDYAAYDVIRKDARARIEELKTHTFAPGPLAG